MSTKPAILETAPTREEERVRRWRVEQLREAGYAHAAAIELAARRDVDLHLAVELLRRGCPPATALRILR